MASYLVTERPVKAVRFVTKGQLEGGHRRTIDGMRRGVATFGPAIKIETERLRFTALRVDDFEEMADVLGDEHLHEFIGGRPLNREELQHRYRDLVAGPSDRAEIWLNWIVRLLPEGMGAGSLQATVTSAGDGRLSADIAWVIGVRCQSQGIGSEAARALGEWLRGNGVERIAACIHPDHHASAGVACHAGLHPTDEYRDSETVWRLPA
jgi:RimJ/RimL family protein N-acetyltransferase